MYLIDSNQCNECGLCVLTCSSNAIRYTENPFSPYVWGMIAAYTECVSKGAKLLAQINVTKEQTGHLSRYLARRGLRCYYRRSGDKLTTFIYKNPSLLNKIKRIDFRSTDPEEHAEYGRLFGYSEEAIQSYIKRVWKPKSIAKKAKFDD